MFTKFLDRANETYSAYPMGKLKLHVAGSDIPIGAMIWFVMVIGVLICYVVLAASLDPRIPQTTINTDDALVGALVISGILIVGKVMYWSFQELDCDDITLLKPKTE